MPRYTEEELQELSSILYDNILIRDFIFWCGSKKLLNSINKEIDKEIDNWKKHSNPENQNKGYDVESAELVRDDLILLKHILFNNFDELPLLINGRLQKVVQWRLMLGK